MSELAPSLLAVTITDPAPNVESWVVDRVELLNMLPLRVWSVFQPAARDEFSARVDPSFMVDAMEVMALSFHMAAILGVKLVLAK